MQALRELDVMVGQTMEALPGGGAGPLTVTALASILEALGSLRRHLPARELPGGGGGRSWAGGTGRRYLCWSWVSRQVIPLRRDGRWLVMVRAHLSRSRLRRHEHVTLWHCLWH
jgi:hypothetical protein